MRRFPLEGGRRRQRDVMAGNRERPIRLLDRCLARVFDGKRDAPRRRITGIALDNEGVVAGPDDDVVRAGDAGVVAAGGPARVQRLVFATVVHACGQRVATEALAFVVIAEPDSTLSFALEGMSTDLQEQLVSEGYRMRVYVPFGSQWYPYLMRRLAERPANVAFITGSVMAEMAGRRRR